MKFLAAMAVGILGSAFILVSTGVVAHFIWICLKAGWNLFGLVVPS